MKELSISNIAIGLSKQFISNTGNDNIKDNNFFKQILDILHKKMSSDLKKYKNCIFICPTLPFICPHHNESYKYLCDIGMTGIFNVLKYPVTQIPLGLNFKNIPLGFQVIGNKYRDHLTVKFAELLELEGITKWIPPKMLNF